MYEDGRFELNVLLRGICKSEIRVFICLETIFPSNDSLMRLTYITYSVWLIVNFSQVKLTHSGSLFTPYMVVIIRPLRFVERNNKNHPWAQTFFLMVSMLISLRQTKPKEDSQVGQVLSSLQLKAPGTKLIFFANSDFFTYWHSLLQEVTENTQIINFCFENSMSWGEGPCYLK